VLIEYEIKTAEPRRKRARKNKEDQMTMSTKDKAMVTRIIKQLQTLVGPDNFKRRSPAFLARHYARLKRLASGPRGISQQRLEKLPGFLPQRSTMYNLSHAANAHGCRIIASGPRGKRRYRFVRRLRVVRAA
jgi:hypothetical protein